MPSSRVQFIRENLGFAMESNRTYETPIKIINFVEIISNDEIIRLVIAIPVNYHISQKTREIVKEKMTITTLVML